MTERATERIFQLLGHISPISACATSGRDSSSDETFHFTVDNDVLTREERQFYEENGFLVVRGLVSLDELEAYRQRFVLICNQEIPAASTMTVMKDVSLAKNKDLKLSGERAITKLQDWQDDEVLFRFVSNPEILRRISCFTGPNIKSVHTMLINKPPDLGSKSSRHPLHQDLHYFPFRPANRIACAWTAMERVNRENGCLVVIPRTHRMELLQHDYPEWEGGVNRMYHGVKLDELPQDLWRRRVHLEMEAGDTVFFHPLLIHGSGQNRTNGYRKAISCHYASADCYFIDVRGSTQELIEQEALDIYRKKVPDIADQFTFQQGWALKSRLLAGNEGTLTFENGARDLLSRFTLT